MEDKTEPYQYQWIDNEGLLRDEGTLYGIAGATIEEKTAAIQDYYRVKKAGPQTKRVRLEKEIADLPAPAAARPFGLIPVVLQLLFYTAICYFNYWLEHYWLTPVFLSPFICLGLYAFGLFSVFIGRSILYNSLTDETDRAKWTIYLEEFGVPLIVSLFIAILPAKSYPLEDSIVAGLLFFMLFLFGGKGLVNTFFRVRGEAALYAQRRRLDTLQNDLESTAAALEALDHEEEYKIKLFTSEYKLAFSSRQLAGGALVKKFA